MTRREWFRRTTAAALGVLFGCGKDKGAGPPAEVKADLKLQGTEEDFQAVQAKWSKLQSLTKNSGEEMTVAVPTGGGYQVLKMAMVTGGAASYSHLRMVLPDSRTANFLPGQVGLSPALKLTDDQGNSLLANGRKIEIPFFTSLTKPTALDPRDFISLGIKVAAAGLLIWAGAGIVNLVLGVIGYLAFAAIILGLLAAAAGVLGPIVSWFLEKTGITFQDIRDFFTGGINNLIILVQNSIKGIEDLLRPFIN